MMSYEYLLLCPVVGVSLRRIVQTHLRKQFSLPLSVSPQTTNSDSMLSVKTQTTARQKKQQKQIEKLSHYFSSVKLFSPPNVLLLYLKDTNKKDLQNVGLFL